MTVRRRLKAEATPAPATPVSAGAPAPFFAAFRRALETRPEATAVVHYADARTAQALSYAGLAAAAGERAAALRSHVAPGGLLFILQEDVREQILWWLAAAFAGLTPGLLTPPTPKLPQRKYLADLAAVLAAHPEAVVVHGAGLLEAATLDELGAAGERLHDAGALLAALPAGTTPARVPDVPRDAVPLVFQQSSGTTGLRKGVLLSEAAVTAQLEAYGRAIDVDFDDVIVSWLPLYHDMGFVACFLGSLYWGVPLVIASPFVWLRRPDWLITAVEAHGGSLCWLPNFAFNLMAERVKPEKFHAGALSSLRLVVNCSEPVLPRSLALFADHFAPLGLRGTALSSSYAMAENVFAVTQSPPGAAPRVETVDPRALEAEGRARPQPGGREVASSGRAVAGTEVIVRGEDGRPLGDGAVGEIALRGACLMDGYFGIGADAPALDAAGWYATGDLGYLRDGELFVIGRRKDIIIRAGRNIDPTRLEAAAGEIAGLKPGRTVAFAVPNADEGTEDIVILAEADGEAPDAETEKRLRAAVVEACQMEAGLAPQAVRILPPGWLLKSSSGKLSRALCREKYLQTLIDEDAKR